MAQSPFKGSHFLIEGIEGGGRLVGFALVKEGNRNTGRPPTLFGGEVRGCARRGCRGGPISGFLVGFGLGPDQELPAGNYRLYVVTDGAPVKIDLEFENLEGRTNLAPAHAAAAKLVSLRARGRGHRTDSVYAGGAYGIAAGSRGIALLGLSLRAPAHVLTAYGKCIYEERPPEGTAFLPGCPNPSPTFGVAPQPATDYSLQTLSIEPDLPEAMGIWYSSVAKLRSVIGLAVWLPLN